MALLALPIAFDPVRLGFNLLLISRPRPAQNLLVYWVGCADWPALVLLLVPILVLHFTPTFSVVRARLGQPGHARQFHRPLRRNRRRVCSSYRSPPCWRCAFSRVSGRSRRHGAPTRSTLLADSDTPHPIARLLGRGQMKGAAAEGGSESAIRRLLSRANDAWESGSLWVALAIGFCGRRLTRLWLYSDSPPSRRREPRSARRSAPPSCSSSRHLRLSRSCLLSNLFAPTKTEAILRLLHDWARRLSPADPGRMLTLVGLALVAQGMGII